MTVPSRPLGKVCDDSAMPDGLVKGQRNQDRQHVNKIDMQDVVEQWHPAEDQQNRLSPRSPGYRQAIPSTMSAGPSVISR